LALTAIAQAGRDDSADHGAGLDPIRVDDSECDSLSQPDGDEPRLPVVPALILALQRRTLEGEGGELEVESAEA
jgi:hypothetical protein